MEDARRAAGDGRRVPAGLDPVAGRLRHGQADVQLADEPRQQPDGVGAAADAREREVGQPPFDGHQLGRRLVADAPLEVAHHRRVRMRAHRRAQHVVGGRDVGDPVAHRLVDGVLERRGAGRDRADLGTQRAHPQHVGCLAPDVLLAHVHDARQAEQGAGRGGRHAVLAGTRLRDDPGLAEAPREQRLAERVVDLVGTRVGEVLALEVQPDRARQRGRAARGQARRLGTAAAASRSARYSAVGRPAKCGRAGRPAPPRTRVVADRHPGLLQLHQRGHERLGHVAATEVALHAPATRAVGLEQARHGPGRVRTRHWAGAGARRACA